MSLWLALLLSLAVEQSQERAPWTASRLTGSPEPPPALRSERVFPALNFKAPVQLVPFPDRSRWALVEEKGMIYSFRNDPAVEKFEVMLDLRKEIRNLDKVEGSKGVNSSFSLVFDPQFAQNRYCYVMYLLYSADRRKPLENGTRISRFKVTESDPPRLDPASEEVLITWLGGGHNGCDLQFGNDGYLYISAGDGEDPSPPDKRATGQDISDLMSSILRIDVHHPSDGRPYGIPKDNPFIGFPKARPEVWCYGLRNPWRMSFDRATGRLWIGDVGWERWEMIYCAEKGGNYGWSVMEGPQVCLPDGKRGPTPILPPAHAIPHPISASLTGGFVYHGRKLAGFEGQYFCGDWESRRVWALPVKDATLGERREVARTALRIVAFAEEADGELLMVDYEGGGLHKLVPNAAAAGNAEFPRTIGKTGLFTADGAPSPGVIPFKVNASAWFDGAVAERWIGVPGTATIVLVDKNKDWPRESVWPKDSVVAKTLSVDGRKVETQVLHFDGQLWNSYSYVWNAAQTDADLAPAEGQEVDLGGGRKWHVLGRAACMGCHTPWQGYILTVNGAQLPDLKKFQDLGLLGKDVPRPKPWVDPYDEKASLDDRARSYMAANCGHCHRFGGGGAAKIDLRQEVPLAEMKVAGVRASLGSFDLTDPYIVCGGDPSRSVLMLRISKLGQGRMPHIGSEMVDERGVRLLRQWIESLPPTPQDPATASSIAGREAVERLKAGDLAVCDKLLSTPTGALDVLGVLAALPEAARKEAIRRALERPPCVIRDLFEAYEPASQRRERLGLSIRPEKILALKGDAERGRQMFAGTAVQCSKCHRAQPGQPELLGPELSKIGAKYKREQILEAILEPSKTIDPRFAGVIVQTTGGDVISAIVVLKTDDELILRDAEKTMKLPAKSVERMVPQQKSLMPEGLLQHLTAQEAADLVEYLASLR